MRCISSEGYWGLPGELEQMGELVAEVVSSLEDCLAWKEGEQP